jgi:hypothetical protein
MSDHGMIILVSGMLNSLQETLYALYLLRHLYHTVLKNKVVKKICCIRQYTVDITKYAYYIFKQRETLWIITSGGKKMNVQFVPHNF